MSDDSPENAPKRKTGRWSYRRTIPISILTGLLAAAGVYYLWPVSYETTAMMHVKVARPHPADSAAGPAEEQAAVATAAKILSSWDVAADARNELAAQSNRIVSLSLPASTEAAAVAAIRSNLEVTVDRDSNLLGVTYRFAEPNHATRILDAILSNFREKYRKIRDSGAGGDEAKMEMALELDSARASVKQLWAQLQELESKSGMVDQAQVKKVAEDLRTTDLELTEHTARLAEIERLSPAAPAELVPEKSRLAGLQARKKALSDRLAEMQEQLRTFGPEIAAVQEAHDLARLKVHGLAMAQAKAQPEQSTMPELSLVQHPSAPVPATGERNALMLALLGASGLLGIATGAIGSTRR